MTGTLQGRARSRAMLRCSVKATHEGPQDDILQVYRVLRPPSIQAAQRWLPLSSLLLCLFEAAYLQLKSALLTLQALCRLTKEISMEG